MLEREDAADGLESDVVVSSPDSSYGVGGVGVAENEKSFCKLSIEKRRRLVLTLLVVGVGDDALLLASSGSMAL